MKVTDKIVTSVTAPKQTDVMWHNPNTGELKIFGKDGWEVVGGNPEEVNSISVDANTGGITSTFSAINPSTGEMEEVTNEASGFASYALGYNTKAQAIYSHAEGNTTVAASECQHVQGRFNVTDSNGVYQFIIGNGTKTTPKNVFAVKWDGTIVMWNNGSALELTPAKLEALLALI